MATRITKAVKTATATLTQKPTKDEALTPANTSNGKPLSEDKIRLLAYQKWEAAGRPEGDGATFWIEAEQQLLHVK